MSELGRPARPTVDILRELITSEATVNDELFTVAVGFMPSESVTPEKRASHFQSALFYGGTERRQLTPDELLQQLDAMYAGPEAHVVAAFAGHYPVADPNTVRTISS